MGGWFDNDNKSNPNYFAAGNEKPQKVLNNTKPEEERNFLSKVYQRVLLPNNFLDRIENF